MCAASPTCNYFTFKETASAPWVKPSFPAGGCYMFDNETPLRRHASTISGPKVCTTGTRPPFFRLELPDSLGLKFHGTASKKPTSLSLGDRFKATLSGMKKSLTNP